MDYYILQEGNKVYKLNDDPPETDDNVKYQDALIYAYKSYINTHHEVKLLIDVATVNDEKCTFHKNIQLNDPLIMEWTDKKE